MTAFSPTALATSSGPTISMTKLCRAGMSRASAMPVSSASPPTIQSSTTPAAVTTPRPSANTPADVCVTISSRRLSTRSASTPAHGPSTRMGPKSTATIEPSATALSVSSRTSHESATDCSQVPLIDTVWAMKYRR